MSVQRPSRFRVVRFVNPRNAEMSVKRPSRFRVVRFVNPRTAEMSVRPGVYCSVSVVRFVNPDTAEMSVRPRLYPSVSVVRFVNPDTAEMSVKGPFRSSVVRFVPFSSPVRLRRETSCAESEVNVFISASVTPAFNDLLGCCRDLLSSLLIVLRRARSGMFTGAAATGGAPASSTTPHIRTNAAIFVIKLLQIFIIICLLCPLFIAM